MRAGSIGLGHAHWRDVVIDDGGRTLVLWQLRACEYASVGGGPNLRGREATQKQLRAAVVSALGGEGVRCVLVEGAPGSGRTSLLEWLAGEMTADATLSHARGSVAEHRLPFAGLYDLCHPLLGYLDGVTQHHAVALRSALALGPPSELGELPLGAALLDLLATAANERPLVLFLDDAELLDPETMRAVAFAIRRLRSEPVAVVAATTEGSETFPREACALAELGPLSAAAMTAVLVDNVATRPHAAVAEALLLAAAGCPGVLVEFTASLTADELSGRTTLPNALPVAARRRAGVLRSLDGLSDHGRIAAAVVAASLTGQRPRVESALRALDVPANALDEAEQGGLIRTDRSHVRTAGPLVGEVIASATTHLRHRVRQALAEAAGAETSSHHRALHLAAAADGVDEAVAAGLTDAADRAQGRGASERAGDLYARAAELTANLGNQSAWRLAAAQCWASAGLFASAELAARDLLADAPSLATEADGSLLLGRVLLATGRGGDAMALLQEAAARVTGEEPERAAALLIQAAVPALHGRRFSTATNLAAKALEVAPPGRVRLRAEVAWGAARVASGDPGGAEPLQRYRALLADAPLPDVAAFLVEHVALVLALAEQHDDALDIVNSVEQRAREAGAPALLPAALTVRALVNYRKGRVVAAFADASEAYHLAEATGQRPINDQATAMLALSASGLGLSEVCKAHATPLVQRPGAANDMARMGAINALLHTAVIDGCREDAMTAVQLLPEESLARGGSVVWGDHDAVDALIALDHRDEAARRLAVLEERALAVPNRRALGMLERTRGNLAASLDAAEMHYREALCLHDYPAGQIRTRWSWAERLVTAGRQAEAVALAREALTMADSLWASGHGRRCRALLAAAGASDVPDDPSPISRLTPDGLALAVAVARGMPTEDLPGYLFLSADTVAHHLEELEQVVRPGDLARLAALADPQPVDRHEAARQSGEWRVEWPAAVRLLGSFEIRRGDVDVTPPAGVLRRLVEVVAVAAEGRRLAEEVIELLWPEAPDGVGRSRLRSAMSRLRLTSGGVLDRQGDLVSLSPRVEVDAHDFEAAARRALTASAAGATDAADRARHALGLYGGGLLPDAVYESWAAPMRERLRRQFLDLLELLAADHALAGRFDQAARLGERLIEEDPDEEAHYVRTAEAYLAAGRRATAQATIRRATTMTHSLGVGPGKAIAALAERLSVNS